ncbi:MAG: GPW/gp25 family protein [Brevundimonas sp.]|uniref:GPW/gp25 family protein n=1 Tax=Brevundimonas sp. TaxID=1871086 RepID=UPI0027248100|nr:GPW/gp25 family protein [Brevundimonas sp.]MDO9607214.1 GPW/gp25 family protein [Brevundimonas sp.]
MSSISRLTGAALDPNSDAHLAQSIGDILTTPIGSRPLRRTYGSELPDLIDQPIDPRRLPIKIFAATAMALLAWEPRVRLSRVQLEAGASGVGTLRLTGKRVDLPRNPTVDFSISVR